MSNSTNISLPLKETDEWSTLRVAKWTAVPMLTLFILILSTVGNGTLLFAYATTPSLRTPFSIYLINLMVANLSCVLIQYPFDIITSLYPFGWFMGDSACTTYLYASFVLQAAVFNAHLMIAVNRIWASVGPITYRSHHSNRTAVSLCVATWLYIHIAMVPEWVMDAMHYRRTPLETHGCLLNKAAQPTSGMVTQLFVFDLPLLVMLAALPTIYFSRIVQRRGVRRNTVGTAASSVQSPNTGVGHGVTASLATQSGAGRPTMPPAAGTRRSHGTLVLVLLTTSVTICWTPSLAFYTLTIFQDIDAPTYYKVVTILFSCQTMLDPVLFTLVLPSLRNALRQLIVCANGV